MPTSFCTLEEAWGEDIQEKSPISRVESIIEPVSKEREFPNLSPQINFNSPYSNNKDNNENESIVKQCDICSLVLEQLKGCPDCLNKFRKMLLPAYNTNTKQKSQQKNRKVLKKNRIIEGPTERPSERPSERPLDQYSDNESDIYESDEEIPTRSRKNNLSTDRIIIYILIGIIIVLLVFELYMSFNRKPFRQQPIIPPQLQHPNYYGSSSNMLHL